MENVSTIVKDFGCVPCGVKIVETFKFENNTEETQLLEVCNDLIKSDSFNENFLSGKLHIQPTQVELHPKQIVCFKLTYYSHVEDDEDNFSYDIFDSKTPVARLIVHAKTAGPSLNPKTFNVKFFCFRDVSQTIKSVHVCNTAKCDAKFYFDIEEGHRYFEVSQIRGVIPGDLKFGLKIKFNPIEPGVYYKKIFCIIQFHEPLIFNLLAVYKPKLKLDPKNLILKYPRDRKCSNNYEAYMHKEEFDKLPQGDKTQSLQKCLENLDLVDITNLTEPEEESPFRPLSPETPVRPECIKLRGEIFLTTSFIDIKSSYEVPMATSILNFSKCQHYYYEWDHDPDDHFQISPCKGLVEPNSKADFTVYFKPPTADRLYHAEMDVKIFLCNVEPEKNELNKIELPLMKSLRIIGHTFPENSCGWIPQCRISPKILHLRACVPDERIYGTFTMEREGHLPITFSVVPAKDPNFTVRPPLGYFSKNFQLFVVQFNSSSKKPGPYAEDLKIKFNNSDMNIETIKVVTSVELPCLLFGVDNKVDFPTVFPKSRVKNTILITNPTRLQLHYEFFIPECMTWLEIVNPTGSIAPKAIEELQLIFKPDLPSEYLDYVTCRVSSAHKLDRYEEMQLQVTGSSEFGYLVATPSIYDFGKIPYKKETTIDIHLFNFSFVLLYFRLRAVNSSFPPGDAEADVTIVPDRGKLSPKGSMKIEVTLTTNNLGYYEYIILCQNFQDDSIDAEPCEPPRKVILLQFDGVLPCIQVVDLSVYNGGSLFSSDMIWKMMCIDQINAALRSPQQRQVIKAKIPEAVKDSNPITLAMLIEPHNSKLTWFVKTETQCPCYEASAGNLQEGCVHTTGIFGKPTKYVSEPPAKTVFLLKIDFYFTNESSLVMTITAPYKKEVILKMPLISLPKEEPTCLSTYFDPTFHLKPVVIGERQPPVQLFWLYNNTDSPASYSLDMMELQYGYEHKVFDCINPEGVIPKYSSYPLGIIFSPNEIMTYRYYNILSGNVDNQEHENHLISLMITAFAKFINTHNFLGRAKLKNIQTQATLELGRTYPVNLSLIAEGVLSVEPLNLIYIKQNLPNLPIIKQEDVGCCENYINFPFLGVHSQATRIFFLENSSTTSKWSFRWASFKAEDVFSLEVEPEYGLIEPGEKVLMTLSVKTYKHPTNISFSIPCEILNETQRQWYKDCLRLQEALEERGEQEFVITDRKVEQTERRIPEAEKPSSNYIFITVNVNVLSDSRIEELINKKMPYCPKATKEIHRNFDFNTECLTPPMVRFVQTFLEKLLWDVVFHQGFLEKLKRSQKSQDVIYKQMLPLSQKKKEELITLLGASPNTRFLQDILNSTLLEIILNKFVPK